MPGEKMQHMDESRFYMWRAVFALAHADGILTEKEKAFVEGYLCRLPLSDAQKDTLRSDLKEPQNVGEMLIGVSKKTDEADFFQFAQMLMWCDGNLAEQENKIIERLTAEQMNKFNRAEVSEMLRQGHAAAKLRREIEDGEFKRQAQKTGLFAKWRKDPEYGAHAATVAKGFGADVMGKMGAILGLSTVPATEAEQHKMEAAMEWMRQKAFEAPTPELFKLWRAVFALVNADGKVTPEEYAYVNGMMDIFRFSAEQREVIREDMEAGDNIVRLFGTLQGTDMMRHYFTFARTIVWSDWQFSDEERAVMRHLVSLLSAAEKQAVAAEIEWIEAKQVPGHNADEEPRRAKTLLSQMIGFYNDQGAAT